MEADLPFFLPVLKRDLVMAKLKSGAAVTLRLRFGLPRTSSAARSMPPNTSTSCSG